MYRFWPPTFLWEELTNPQQIGGPHGVCKAVCWHDVNRPFPRDNEVGPLLRKILSEETLLSLLRVWMARKAVGAAVLSDQVLLCENSLQETLLQTGGLGLA